MRSPKVVVVALAFVIVGSALALLAPARDEALVLALHAPASAGIGRLARELTALGSHAVIAALMLVVAGIALAARHAQVALIAFAQGAGAMVLSFALKLVVQRPRTQVESVEALLTYAFPSGHALLAAAAWPWLGALLALREPVPRARAWYVAAGVLLAAMIAATRVMLGMHRPSEVLAGFGFGLAWGWLCWRWANPVVAARL